MLRPGHICASVGVTACLLLAGCSGAALPELPSLATDTTSTGGKTVVEDSPTDIYARIARGAMACWFGTAGPLKANYIYHASAEPPSKGGNANIVIRERDKGSNNTGGLRAFRVSVTPVDDESSELVVENLKLPGPQAKSMTADVRRWATGAIGCSKANAAGEWDPQPSKAPEKRK